MCLIAQSLLKIPDSPKQNCSIDKKQIDKSNSTSVELQATCSCKKIDVLNKVDSINPILNAVANSMRTGPSQLVNSKFDDESMF